jgi:hypothetical protein
VPSATTAVRAGDSRGIFVVETKVSEGLAAKWLTVGIVGIVVVLLR